MPRPPKKTSESPTPRRSNGRRQDEPAGMPDAAGMGVAPSAAAEATREEGGRAENTRAVSERKPPTTASHTTADSAPHKSPVTMSSNISDEEIRRRAYELYEQRGGNGGSAEEDWYRAEQELRTRKGMKSA